MRLNIELGQLLKHLSFWHNKSDEECIEMATNEYGLDAEEALMNIIESQFCTSLNNSVIEELKKYNT
jgi:hypothetical protein